MIKFLSAILLTFGIIPQACAQTNTTQVFQGFRPGDAVQVQSLKPLVILGQAVFESQRISHIVVVCKGDRYSLNKATVTLSKPRTQQQPPSSGASSSSATTLLSTKRSVVAGEPHPRLPAIQQQIVGPFAGQAGYAEAGRFYQDTMQALQEGQLDLTDIVGKAQQVLGQLDSYLPERTHNPQFESYVQQLRSFVRRAMDGEELLTSQAP